MTTRAQIRGLGEFARWGFTPDYRDDHIVELRHRDEFVARFSQGGRYMGASHWKEEKHRL